MYVGSLPAVMRTATRMALASLTATVLLAAASGPHRVDARRYSPAVTALSTARGGADGFKTGSALGSRSVGVTAISIRDAATRDQQLDAIKSEGLRAVRLIVEWPLIEATQGRFDWAPTDAIVNGAAARDLTILGLITYAPAWAATPEGRNYVHPGPADPSTFVEFSRLAAQRYGAVIHDWEIWNEPNIVESFAPRPDVTTYTAMLNGAYRAIKSIDPRAVVIAGGLSPAADTDHSISPGAFVDGMTQASASFDGVGMHPYSSPELLSQGTEPWSSKVAIAQVTDLLRSRGRSDAPLWFTEFGASSSSLTERADDSDHTGQRVGVSEGRQAEILADGLGYLQTLPNAGPVFVFDHRDLEPGDTSVESHYGLLHYDFSPKPALGAVQRFLGAA